MILFLLFFQAIILLEIVINMHAIDYTNCINYSECLTNDILNNGLKLYFFYNKLFQKIKQENNSEENYYL